MTAVVDAIEMHFYVVKMIGLLNCSSLACVDGSIYK